VTPAAWTSHEKRTLVAAHLVVVARELAEKLYVTPCGLAMRRRHLWQLTWWTLHENSDAPSFQRFGASLLLLVLLLSPLLLWHGERHNFSSWLRGLSLAVSPAVYKRQTLLLLLRGCLMADCCCASPEEMPTLSFERVAAGR